MEKIIDLHERFFTDLTNNRAIRDQLETAEIRVIEGFISNLPLVRRFYQTVYPASNKPAIVLCGINPGRHGTGKTGVPFLDYKGLSKFLPEVTATDQEKSAQFMLSVINDIGQDTFFQNIYMTNISWFGFTRYSQNLNYYDLPETLPTHFTQSFIQEMAIIQPKIIIPLSTEVERSIQQMNLPYQIGKRLPHPYYSSIGKREPIYKKLYIDTIQELLQGEVRV